MIETSITLDPPRLNDCWNQIGVMGDRTCAELKAAIHCHECPVFASAGDSLLERQPPLNYQNEWMNVLSQTSVEEDSDSNEGIIRTTETISVMIVRLGNEQVAFPTSFLQEVTPTCTIQPLPHRSNKLFLGLVNIRGEILLCASLAHLLNLESSHYDSPTVNLSKPKKMIVAGDGDNKWVFPVDEVYGIYRFQTQELQNAPVVIAKASEAYTQGIINWQGKKVNYLDSELIFYTINHKIL
jgi:chemotaxis-related protein WspD